MLRHSDLVTLRGAPPATTVFPLRWPTTVDANESRGKIRPALKGPFDRRTATRLSVTARSDRFTVDILRYARDTAGSASPRVYRSRYGNS